jgi:hypothetical protein
MGIRGGGLAVCEYGDTGCFMCWCLFLGEEGVVSEFLGVLPGELRVVSGRLAQVSSAMGAVLGGLRSGLAAEGAVWGDDAIGESFAGGAGGFVAQRQWVDESVAAKRGLLDFYAEMLKAAADSFDGHDGA